MDNKNTRMRSSPVEVETIETRTRRGSYGSRTEQAEYALVPSAKPKKHFSELRQVLNSISELTGIDVHALQTCADAGLLEGKLTTKVDKILNASRNGEPTPNIDYLDKEMCAIVSDVAKGLGIKPSELKAYATRELYAGRMLREIDIMLSEAHEKHIAPEKQGLGYKKR